MRLLASLAVSSVLVGCGSSAAESEPAKAPSSAAPHGDEAKAAAKEAHEAEASGAPAASGIPKECAGSGDFCAMPKDFVSRLCQDTYPNVALLLFAKGTPWSHGYLTRKTEAWNAEGGASVQGFVEFDEEVVLLASHMPPKGGMQVSGAGGYQAIRWDGSCVTLSAEEVTTRRPPSPKHPRIEWRYIEDGMRDALRKDASVDAAAVAQRKECKGVSVGDVSKKCVDADQKLGDAIVQFVLTDGTLPQPQKLP